MVFFSDQFRMIKFDCLLKLAIHVVVISETHIYVQKKLLFFINLVELDLSLFRIAQ